MPVAATFIGNEGERKGRPIYNFKLVLVLILVQNALGSSLPGETEMIPISQWSLESLEEFPISEEAIELTDHDHSGNSGMSSYSISNESPTPTRIPISSIACSNRLRRALQEMCGGLLFENVGEECCLRPCSLTELRKYCVRGNGGLFRVHGDFPEPSSSHMGQATGTDITVPDSNSFMETCQNPIRACGGKLRRILMKACGGHFKQPLPRVAPIPSIVQLRNVAFLFSRFPRAGLVDECCESSCCLEDVKTKYCANGGVPKSEIISRLETTEVINDSGMPSSLISTPFPSSSTTCSSTLLHALSNLCDGQLPQTVREDCCRRSCSFEELREYCGRENVGKSMETAQEGRDAGEVSTNAIHWNQLTNNMMSESTNANSHLESNDWVNLMQSTSPHPSQKTCKTTIQECGPRLTARLWKACPWGFNSQPSKRSTGVPGHLRRTRSPRAGIADECCKARCCWEDMKKKYCQPEPILVQLLRLFMPIVQDEIIFPFVSPIISNRTQIKITGGDPGPSETPNPTAISPPINAVTEPYPTLVIPVGQRQRIEDWM